MIFLIILFFILFLYLLFDTKSTSLYKLKIYIIFVYSLVYLIVLVVFRIDYIIIRKKISKIIKKFLILIIYNNI